MRIWQLHGGHRRLIAAVTGAAAVLGPGAVPASAATLTVDKPCYVNLGSRAAPMTVAGTGFGPGDTVNIASNDGTVDTSATADGSGSILVVTNAPTPFSTLPGAKTQALTAMDFAPDGTTATATVPVTSTSLEVVPSPNRAKLTSKVTWYFAGFTPGAVIFGHYLRKRQVARARFGRAQGPCGVLKTRARFYPGGHPRYSSYKLQFDNSRPYSPRTRPRVVVTIGKVLL